MTEQSVKFLRAAGLNEQHNSISLQELFSHNHDGANRRLHCSLLYPSWSGLQGTNAKHGAFGIALLNVF